MNKVTKATVWFVGVIVAILISMLAFVGLLFMGTQSANANCLPLKSAVQAGQVVVQGGPAADAYFAQTPQPGVIAQKKANAAIIISVGRQMGLSEHSVAIGVATSIQESGLLNLSYGDRDSLGLFQQRPSVGSWGTAAEIMDPTHAATAFFNALKRIPDRDQIPMMEAAIRVQIPSRAAYERTWHWDEIATEIVSGTPKGQNMCTGWVSPLEKYSAKGGDPFGMRQLSDDPVPRLHEGQDMPAPEGTPIRAASSGVITYVGVYSGYGNYVSIDHGNKISTGYGHMSRFADIHVGMHVDAGQVIGYVGNTGHSFGDHLHFETVVNGKKVDPVQFMKEHGVDLMKVGG